MFKFIRSIFGKKSSSEDTAEAPKPALKDSSSEFDLSTQEGRWAAVAHLDIDAQLAIMFPEWLDDPLPQVTLRRLAPAKDGSWPISESWLGGLPWLGDQPWPIDKCGVPMHHLASISLTELARLTTDGLFPNTGRLSFFTGRRPDDYPDLQILHTDGAEDTKPPAGLRPLDNEFGSSERTGPEAVLDRYPVQLSTEPWPQNTKRQDDGRMEAYRIWKEEYEADRTPFYWNMGYRLLHGLKKATANDNVERAIANKAPYLKEAEERAKNASTEGDRARAQKLLQAQNFELEAYTTKLDDYRAFIDAVEQKVLAHDRWSVMTGDYIEWFRDALAAVRYNEYDTPDQHTHFGAIYRLSFDRLHSLDDAASDTYSTIVNQPAPVIADLPPKCLESLDYRPGFAPNQGQHQMFGIGLDIQGQLAEFADHYLLLQLHYDKGAGLQIGDVGVIQFMIKPDDLAARNWDAVRITMAGN